MVVVVGREYDCMWLRWAAGSRVVLCFIVSRGGGVGLPASVCFGSGIQESPRSSRRRAGREGGTVPSIHTITDLNKGKRISDYKNMA